MVGALEMGRKYRVSAQFTRPMFGGMGLMFPVTAEVTVVDANGMSQTQSVTKNFRIQDLRAQWVAFEIDGTTGAITTVDMTMR